MFGPGRAHCVAIGGVIVVSLLGARPLYRVGCRLVSYCLGDRPREYEHSTVLGVEDVVPTVNSGPISSGLAFLNGRFLSRSDRKYVNTVRRAKRDVKKSNSCIVGPYHTLISRGRAKFCLVEATIADALVIRNWLVSELKDIPDLRHSDTANWMPRMIGAILYCTDEERDLYSALQSSRSGAFMRQAKP
jgi:hypothetical protein